MRTDLQTTALERSLTGVHNAPAGSKTKIPHDEFFAAVINANLDDLSSMFERGQVDLTAVNDAHGQPALHLAIALGHDGIADLLLARCDDNPEVLYAQDREGYTPLMRAVEGTNLNLMQALVKAGTSLEARKHYVHDPSDSPKSIAMSKAEILIEAQGDLDVALEISVKESSKTTAKWLSDMGADPRPALLHFANQGNDNALTALIYDGLSDSEEVEHVLSNAVISGNATATRALLEAEPGAAETGLLRRWSILGDTQALKFMFDAGAVGDEALLAIAKDTTLSVGEKVNALRLLLSFLPNAGADTDYLLKELMTEGRADIKAMKCLVAAGVPTVEILMDQAKAGNLLGASALIKSGADYATAMKTLANDAQQDAVNVLGVAMAYGRKS